MLGVEKDGNSDVAMTCSRGKIGTLRVSHRVTLGHAMGQIGDTESRKAEGSHPRPFCKCLILVERRRIELPTFALRTRRSPS